MARLRQLPQLYLRGAIANETMRNLPREEQNHINELTLELAASPLLVGHKQEFMMKLGQTIGGDYRDDRAAAEAEFQIAVWRGLVYLLHHTDYSYVCNACNNGSYLTQRNKMKAFDRRYPICPNCTNVRIVDPGDSVLKKGQFVHHEHLQRIVAACVGKAPQCASPIAPIKGDRKVADHHAVLNNPDQISKFFGEFIWNYFRQHLRENEIKYHTTDGRWVKGASGKRKFEPQILVAGAADLMAVEECLSVLVHNKYQHCYQPSANPYKGAYHIQADMDCADCNLVKKILALTIKYRRLDVDVIVSDHGITVKEPQELAVTVKALVVKPQVVTMQSRSLRIDDEEGDDLSIYDTNHHQIVGGASMQEDGIAKVESDDLLSTIRASLPDGAQQVLDILTQTGETWQRFCLPQNAAVANAPRGVRASAVKESVELIVSDRQPKEMHIARFLGVSPRQMKQWMSDIRMQCLAHNLTNQR